MKTVYIALIYLLFLASCQEILLKKNGSVTSTPAGSQDVETGLGFSIIETPLSHGDQNYITSTSKTSNGGIFVSTIAGDASGGWEWSTIFKSSDDGATFSRVNLYTPFFDGESHFLATAAYNNDIYVCGYEWNFNPYDGLRWIIRKSSDGGSTWSLVDDHRTASQDKTCRDMAVNQATGAIYAIGEDSEVDNGAGGTTTGVIIRESTDGGNTWNTIYTFGTTSGLSRGYNIAVLPSGDLLIGAFMGTTNTRRILRGSFSGTWSFTDLGYDLGAGTGFTGYQISGDILAVDNNTYYYSGRIGDRWQIVKTDNAGATWNLVYTGATNRYIGHGIMEDSSGDIYAIGIINGASSSSDDDLLVIKTTNGGTSWTTAVVETDPRLTGIHLIEADNGDIQAFAAEQSGTRRYSSSDGGSTWTARAHLHLEEKYYNELSDLKVNSLGHYFVTGYIANIDDTHTDPWYVGRSTDQGSTWASAEIFTIPAANFISMKTIEIANNDDIFALGSEGYTSPTPSVSVIRKSSNNGATWSTIDSFSFGTSVYNNVAGDIAIDSSGNLFHCVNYLNPSPNVNSDLRVNPSYGTGVWTTPTTFPIEAGSTQFRCLNLYVSSDDSLWLVGLDRDSGGTWNRIVYRSTDQGVSWTNTLSDVSSSANIKMTGDSLGNIYYIANNEVRITTDNGATWSTFMNSSFGPSHIVVDGSDQIFVLNSSDELYRYEPTAGPIFWIKVEEQLDEIDPTGKNYIYPGFGYLTELALLGPNKIGILGVYAEQRVGWENFVKEYDTTQ